MPDKKKSAAQLTKMIQAQAKGKGVNDAEQAESRTRNASELDVRVSKGFAERQDHV